MKYRAHICGGIVSSACISYLVNKNSMPVQVNDINFFISATIGALLPDIDHPKSLFGSGMKVISNRITHRGITHSLVFAVVSGFFGLIFSVPVAIGLFIGTFSHLILDMIDVNGNGVCLFAPFSFQKIGANVKKRR